MFFFRWNEVHSHCRQMLSIWDLYLIYLWWSKLVISDLFFFPFQIRTGSLSYVVLDRLCMRFFIFIFFSTGPLSDRRGRIYCRLNNAAQMTTTHTHTHARVSTAATARNALNVQSIKQYGKRFFTIYLWKIQILQNLVIKLFVISASITSEGFGILNIIFFFQN